MWRPPERIKHAPPEPGWPTRQQAQQSRLFAPLALKSGLRLATRTWVPAMVPWRATEDGRVTEELLAWYGRFARGRPGVIVVEATGIRDVPSGPLLRIGDDRFIDGLRTLTERVRAESGGRTRLLLQLIDFLRIRRRPQRDKFLGRFLTISAAHRSALKLEDASEKTVREALACLDDEGLSAVLSEREYEALTRGFRERVTDTALPHIRALPARLPALFASAARRAKDAGFDGVELHCAHAYTLASFLSRHNTRSDGYGDSPQGRLRLPLEVFRAVRAEVGDAFTVGCRMLCDESIVGGSRVADASFYAVELARAGMDYISLSTGGKFEDAKQPRVGHAVYPYTGPSGYECMPTVHSDAAGPFSRQVPKQARINQALVAANLQVPVVIAGGIGTFLQAEEALSAGHGDLIAAARQSLADPDWWLKMELGLGGEIRRCKYTNYCEALDQKHKRVTCQLWDQRRTRWVAPPWEPPQF